MIPILYEYNEQDFDSFGLCNLPDCTLAEVLEQRNGQNELTLRCPIIGANYDEIRAERIIGVYANDSKKVQGYRIYELSKPLNGVVTVYARHVSSDLSGVPCPIINGTYTPASAMAVLFQGTDFTGWFDIATSLTVKKDEPVSVMSALGGVEGSLLDLFGGEYEFDNFTVKLHAHRGQDNGVIVEYGKNITQLVDDFSTEDVYSAILPYATYYNEDGEETLVRGNKTSFQTILNHEKVAMIDFSDKFDETTPPTVAALDTLAQAYIDAHNPGTTESNINVSFIPLWYDNGGDAIALCDTITIRHDRLGVDAKAKVVETVYDCLTERFTRVTCGKSTSNFAQTVAELRKEDDKTRSTIVTIPSRTAQAIARATKLITGNDGGNVILHEGPNGKPYELLIMDNADISQAVNVWRWNLAGLGFSSNGYAGPYEIAITSDGQINADMITTGQLDADLITTGRLLIEDANNNAIFDANVDTGVVTIGGFTVTKDKFTNTSGTTTVDIGSDGSFEVRKGNSLAYIRADSLGVSYQDRFVEIINDGGGTRLWAYSPNGISRVEPGTVSATDSSEENSTTLYPTGVVFDDDQGHATTLTAWGYSLQAAGTMNITLKAGMYLAIVTRAGSSETAQTGLYVIQAYSTNSTVKELSAATASTLSVSGLTLTWTTTNSLRALRLIRLS